MQPKPSGILIAALLLSPLGFAATAQAEPRPENLIKYRQNVMKFIGGHMGAMALIMRGKVDYMPQLLDHARALAVTAKDIKEIFPPDSAEGDTAAKPEI